MNENTQEKSLVKVNNKGIFYKIKDLIKSIFTKNYNIKTDVEVKENNSKNDFIQSLKNIENDETMLLKLQKKYRGGEIKEDELTEEQVKCLCNLYDRQIARLKKSNELRKQKLKEYRRRLQTNN